jgi:phage/plasmid-like protein (TIGR03299 family)
MAHEIEYREDRAQWSFAFTGNRSAIWHRHGQETTEGSSIEHWMRQSGQDYQVEKIDLVESIGHTGEWLPNFTHAIRRTDNNAVLSLCSKQWVPAQNADAYAFLEPLIAAGFCVVNTAGTLFDGRRCFVLAKTREGFQLPGGDDTEGYILVQISHDYGIADLVLPTAVRVVCNNTLQAALRGKNKEQMDAGKFVHREKTSFSVDKAQAIIEAYRAGLGEYAEQARFLASKVARPEQTRAYINKVFGLEALVKGTAEEIEKRHAHNERILKTLLETVETQPGANMSAGTWWQNLHAVTFFEDHGRFTGRDETVSTKFQGPSAERKKTALRVALEMAS